MIWIIVYMYFVGVSILYSGAPWWMTWFWPLAVPLTFAYHLVHGLLALREKKGPWG